MHVTLLEHSPSLFLDIETIYFWNVLVVFKKLCRDFSLLVEVLWRQRRLFNSIFPSGCKLDLKIVGSWFPPVCTCPISSNYCIQSIFDSSHSSDEVISFIRFLAVTRSGPDRAIVFYCGKNERMPWSRGRLGLILRSWCQLPQVNPSIRFHSGVATLIYTCQRPLQDYAQVLWIWWML